MIDPDIEFAHRMAAIQRGVLEVAMTAGIQEVEIPGKSGTAAREFDIAAHHHIEESIAALQRGGYLVGATVLTEETPYMKEAVGKIAAHVTAHPTDDLHVLLWDPVDGSMQRLKSGIGWCTAGLSCMWSGADQLWRLTWASVMLPGGADAVWLPEGKGWPADPEFVAEMASRGGEQLLDLSAPMEQRFPPTDTLAVNVFGCGQERRDPWLAAIPHLKWARFVHTTGGNPLAVEAAKRGTVVVVQPQPSTPHDTIGTLILSQLGFDVYDLDDPEGKPINPGALMSKFANPTEAHLKGIPPHVVGPPTRATRESWGVFHEVRRLQERDRDTGDSVA